MSDCPNGDIRDLLPDFLHDGLAASERALVEAHLRDCALCRQELALLRGMRAALRQVPAVDVHRIVEAIPPYRAPSRQVSSRSWGGWRIAAAITLLAAGGTSIAVARRGASTPQDSVQVARVERADSLPASAHVQGPVDPAVSPSARAPEVSASPAPRELALAGSTIGDLDDQELSALIDDIGSLHAVTPVDVDNAASISPIAPTSPSGMNN
jgi:anti-sigma factor RsiW